MIRTILLTHEFVEFIPDQLDDGVLYVSIPCGLAVHKCFCGCQNKVVTPFSPHDWKLTFDGDTVTLNPSIGNWKFPCQSHYWIRENKVIWVEDWKKRDISQPHSLQKKDFAAKKKKHFLGFLFKEKQYE